MRPRATATCRIASRAGSASASSSPRPSPTIRKLLIADEPTTALDVTIQAQVLQLIDRLRREHGTTVLLITHDLGVVATVCDRVGVMYGGRLLETLDASALFTAASHPYTRALIARAPPARRAARACR